MVSLKFRYLSVFILVIPFCSLFFIQFHEQNKLEKAEKTYFSLERLKNKVTEDKSEGDVIINDINISEFVDKIKQDNLKWNITTYTDDQIEGKLNSKCQTKPTNLIYLKFRFLTVKKYKHFLHSFVDFLCQLLLKVSNLDLTVDDKLINKFVQKIFQFFL